EPEPSRPPRPPRGGRARPAGDAGLQPPGRGVPRDPGLGRRRGAVLPARRPSGRAGARLDAARRVGDRDLPPPARPARDAVPARHHALGPLRGGGPRSGAGDRGRRLRDQALCRGRASGPRARPASPRAALDRGAGARIRRHRAGCGDAPRHPLGPAPQARSDRVPPPGRPDGETRPRLVARATARPRLGPRHLRGHPHRRCPCRPPSQGADGAGRGRSAPDRAGRRLRHRI
ncbi:MAG: Phosphate regulon transcriptional regulatory protein PhoB (SphR), partial [uncultured Rubellimicrobium sp.]